MNSDDMSVRLSWRELQRPQAARFRLLPRFRTKESPRFSSALRSVAWVAIWTGSPADSRPSQRFNSSREDSTYRPCFLAGIPSAAHRWTTDTGWPRKVAICCQPFSTSVCWRVFVRFGTKDTMRHLT